MALCIRVLQRGTATRLFLKIFVMRNWFTDWGGQQVPRPAVCKVETHGSRRWSSSPAWRPESQASRCCKSCKDRKTAGQSGGERVFSSLAAVFCSGPQWVGCAHPHWGGCLLYSAHPFKCSALLNTPTQTHPEVVFTIWALCDPGNWTYKVNYHVLVFQKSQTSEFSNAKYFLYLKKKTIQFRTSFQISGSCPTQLCFAAMNI